MVPARVVRPWHIFAVATLLSFYSAFQAKGFVTLFNDKPQPFLVLLAMNAGYWFSWALVVPAILWIAGRYPFDRSRWRRSVPIHLLVALIVIFLHVAMSEAVWVNVMNYLWEGATRKLSWWPRVQRQFVMNFDWEMPFYIGIVGFSNALSYYRQAQDRTLRASQLETRLAEAQLQALQRQLHPHFLFNTLNAISALMHRDVEEADQMLTRLSDLLRMALDQRGVQEIALKDELDFLQKYLEIEQTRFGNRLTVSFDIDPITLDAQVPNLLLQPLVENSVRHAIATRVEGGVIEIRARRTGAHLELQVRDNGPGLPNLLPPTSGKGVGLPTTRSRLEHLYGGGQRLEFSQPPGGGLVVTVVIPFKGDDPVDMTDDVADDIKGVA
jgi:two-component system, LytTR family, sensor kinase